MAHAVDLLVDGGVLLDVGVRAGNVGLGLVVVVVGDEILDRVVGKKALHLPVELRRQRLVGGQHQGRALHRGDHPGHGEGLAGAGDPEQNLIALAAGDRGGELGDGLRLIAGGRVFRLEVEGNAAFGPLRRGRARACDRVECGVDGHASYYAESGRDFHRNGGPDRPSGVRGPVLRGASDARKLPAPDGRAAYGLSLADAEPDQALAHGRHQQPGHGIARRGQGRDRSQRGGARFRHPRPHSRGGQGGDRCRRHALHRCRRHARPQAGDLRQVQAREWPRLRARPDQRRHRRQADPLQRLSRLARPRRRGGLRRALLGLLPRHGADGRRHAGDGGDEHRRRLQDERGRPRGGADAEDQVGGDQLAEQPLGRRLPRPGSCGR